MRARSKQSLLRVLPPILVDRLRAVGLRGPREWEYLGTEWPVSAGADTGWDHDSVAAAQLAEWRVVAGRTATPGVLSPVSGTDGHPTISDYGAHNTLMTFGYILGRVAGDRQVLSMLDWGGGLGQYAVRARAMFPALSIEYHCLELPGMARAGAQVLADATFYDTDTAALGRRYDFVMASGSLQYAADWQRTLTTLADATAGYLYVTRLPTLSVAGSFVALHRPRRAGYQTAYPGWFVNRHELLRTAVRSELQLEREFLIWEGGLVIGAPEQADYRGFLFVRPASR